MAALPPAIQHALSNGGASPLPLKVGGPTRGLSPADLGKGTPYGGRPPHGIQNGKSLPPTGGKTPLGSTATHKAPPASRPTPPAVDPIAALVQAQLQPALQQLAAQQSQQSAA